MQQTTSRPVRLFPYVAIATVLLTFGLIVFGAVVRVTDSGLGCGNSWPLCDGKIFPPLDNLTAWIEWLHRLFAALIGALGLGMLALAIYGYRKHNPKVLMITAGAAILFTIQSLLGAIVVLYDLPPTTVTLHLGTAMLLLAALLLAGITAIYQPQQRYGRDNFTTLAYITTALSLVIILSGALVRGTGATLACTDWPLCNGAVWPAGQGQLAMIHMLHRFAVLALGITLAMLLWYALRERQHPGVRLFAALSLFGYLTQAGIGAMYVFSSAAPVWGALHVAFAAATWAFLVVLSAIETLNTGEVSGETADQQWKPQSELISN
jgi:heme A synthase